MKKIVIQIMLVLLWVNLGYTQSDATTGSNKSDFSGYKKKDFLQLTIQSGFINPVSPALTKYYYTSLNVGFDLSYRVNTEVALYGEVRHNFLTAVDSIAPSSGYFETTFGARYYMRLARGRSSLFFESGVGPYIFVGGSSNIPGQMYESKTKIRLGGNIGIGGELVITNSLFFTLKSKMNSIFDSNGSTTYISGIGGFSIRL
jgi:hypothetical protein